MTFCNMIFLLFGIAHLVGDVFFFLQNWPIRASFRPWLTNWTRKWFLKRCLYSLKIPHPFPHSWFTYYDIIFIPLLFTVSFVCWHCFVNKILKEKQDFLPRLVSCPCTDFGWGYWAISAYLNNDGVSHCLWFPIEE